MSVLTLRPIKDGDRSENGIIGAADYEWVATSDQSDSTSIYAHTSGKVSLFRILPADRFYTIGNISNVRIKIRCWRSGSETTSTATKLKTHETEYEGSSNALTGTPSDYYTDYATNPYTGTAWTLDEASQMQIGVRLSGTSGSYATAAKCSEVCVEITCDGYSTISTITLRPASDGYYHYLETFGSGTGFYGRVNESVVDDSNGWYSGSYTTRYYATCSLSSGSNLGVIKYVRVYIRHKTNNSAPSVTYGTVRLRRSSTNNDINLTLWSGGDYVNDFYDFYTDPFTSGEWSWENLNSTQFGAGLNNDGTNASYISQLYVIVGYLPSSGRRAHGLITF